MELEAIGLNFADLYGRRGDDHPAGAAPFAALGDSGSAFAMGDRVGFADRPHGRAVQAPVRLDRWIPLPEDVSSETRRLLAQLVRAGKAQRWSDRAEGCAGCLRRTWPHTDSVCFADNPELHRIASSTPGTRFSPSRIRSG